MEYIIKSSLGRLQLKAKKFNLWQTISSKVICVAMSTAKKFIS
ncbi:MAG: hypothetical protein O4861_14280 [Trichodesmium sp. St16_bin4-tuft]|nr:hypothetical protein [Trichodesmium sp. St4_bin8_1]MDE5071766.1 hypothetical protein [Trichodesmium sp. St5_bin8]MDE5078663.1 hypothetical protein [Trichodesmium sp. St2_bin6]MDE5099429.1 hypothetical protein [Trichodesmium sp. St16_bin4-tuft]